MTDSATTERAAEGPRAFEWGLWETAAAAVLFCAPALVQANPWREPASDPLNALEWAAIACAAAAGLVLTAVAGGLRASWAFLTTGFVTSFVWLVVAFLCVDDRSPCDKIAQTYMWLGLALLVAHYHMLPAAIISARRSACEHRGVPFRLTGDVPVMGLLVSVALFDLTPLAWLLVPGRRVELPALIWMAVTLSAGGVFAALAANDLALGEANAPGAAPAGTEGGKPESETDKIN